MAEKDMKGDHQDLSPAEQRARFWKRLEGVTAGMLGLTGDLKLVPMSHHADPQAHALWFITAADTHLAEGCAGGPQDALHVVADGSGKLYARIEGQLSLSDDQAKLDEIWSSVADTWFQEGREDPDVRLLKFSVSGAEVWTTTGSVGFLYAFAKSKVTGDAPDMGDHFTLA